MLFDPKWEVKTNVPSLAGIIAWLETQEPTATYNFHACGGLCLIGQYMTHIGIEWGYDGTDSRYLQVCKQITGHEWNAYFAFAKPWTFGAALERAKALQS